MVVPKVTACSLHNVPNTCVANPRKNRESPQAVARKLER